MMHISTPSAPLSLTKKAEQVLDNYYPSCSQEVLTQEMEMKVADSTSPVMRFVVNFHARGYADVSENIQEILGVSASELISYGLSRSVNLFIPSHRAVFSNSLLPFMMEWFRKMADEGRDLLRVRLVYHISMIHSNGKAISTMHIMKPLSLDVLGLPLLAVKYICDISYHQPQMLPVIRIEYKNEKGEFELVHHRTFFLETEKDALSVRELEILTMVKKGYSSKEIATMLHISLHTVNNHRKNIVQKRKVKSLHQIADLTFSTTT